MLLQICDWCFEIDKTQTQYLSRTELEDNCTCDFCQNFYGCVKTYYPSLESFLNQFGLELFAPASLEPYTHKDAVECAMKYMVLGSISRFGSEPVCVDNAQITFHEDGEALYLVFNLVLPWVLSFPIEKAKLANGESVLPGFWENKEFSS